MPDPSGVPKPAHDRQSGESMLSSISREMVQAMKKYYGKGPVQAKSYLMDDLLFVVMRGGITASEETMIQAGQEDAVRDFRQRFENEMAERLTGTIEQLTGRKVVNYQSQVMFDPDIVVELFVFDATVPKEAQRETALAIVGPDNKLGVVSGDEVE